MISFSPAFKSSCFFFLFILCILYSKVFSQKIEGVNARLDAMAGIAAADDIGWSMVHPTNINKFPNQFQSSICITPIPDPDETYGVLMGIISLGELLYIGAILHNKMILEGGYYNQRNLFLETPHYLTEKQSFNIPQVNLCLKPSDNFQIGVGGYFEEGSFYDKEKPKITLYSSLWGMDTINYTHKHDNKSIKNRGVNIEIQFNIKTWAIYPQLLIGFPKIEGSDSINELDQSIKTFSQVPSTAGGTFSNIANTYSSSEVSYIIGGSNFSGNIGKTFWLGGAFYENYRYKFTRNTTIETGLINANGSLVGDTLLSIVNYDSTGLEHRDQWVHYFLSFVPNFSNNFFLSLEYNGGFGWHHMPVFLAKIDSSFFMRYHNFRVGVEMVFSNIGWFDILCARGGMQAHWGQIYTERIIPFNSWFWSTDFSKNGGKFTGGFGLTKKRITFDISFDFIKWLIDQDETLKMAEILATLTFDFHSKKEY